MVNIGTELPKLSLKNWVSAFWTTLYIVYVCMGTNKPITKCSANHNSYISEVDSTQKN